MNYFAINCFVCLLTVLLATSEAFRILGVFPVNARSHFGFHEAMMNSLVDAGHRVTVISPFAPKRLGPNCTHIDSRPKNSENQVNLLSRHDFRSKSWLAFIQVAIESNEKYCYNLVKLEDVQKILNSDVKLYDVMFVEALPMYECHLAIAKILRIPVISTVSLRAFARADKDFGNPRNPAVVPFDAGFFGMRMNFWKRVVNTATHVVFDVKSSLAIPPRLDKFYKEHYPNLDYRTIPKSSLLFINNHPAIFPRAQVPNAVNVGGIHIKSALPTSLENKDVKKFIDESEQGVILFSLGTVTKSSVVDDNLKNIFREVFAKIPQRVIWKLEEKVQGLSDNVLLMDWVPQKEILAHKNVVAFITHCGLSGLYEAVYGGTPLVMLPIFGDQKSNAIIMQDHGVGVCLDITNLSKEDVLDAINTVVNDRKYLEKMQDLSRVFKDDVFSPEETVLRWTEYVVRHNGTPYLRTVAADMPFYQYSLLDVIAFMIAVAGIVILSLYYSCRMVYCFIFGDQKCRISQKKKT